MLCFGFVSAAIILSFPFATVTVIRSAGCYIPNTILGCSDNVSVVFMVHHYGSIAYVADFFLHQTMPNREFVEVFIEDCV
jgi:hypothetical protein